MNLTNMYKQIECYFDGACEPNPGGQIGAGIYIIDGDNEITESFEREPAPGNTNNVAEYIAIIEVLNRILIYKQCRIAIYGDSRLVINQLNGRYKVNSGSYLPYYKQASELLKGVRRKNIVTLQWIPREDNAIADQLSRESFVKEVVNWNLIFNDD